MSNPNIILIVADDLGWGDLQGFNPNSPILTPCLDLMGVGGTRFSNYHSMGAVCTPSRVSLMTGQEPHSLNSRSVPNRESWGIPSGTETIPQLLDDYGNYYTVHIGKWHIGNPVIGSGNSPQDYGFEDTHLTTFPDYYAQNPSTHLTNIEFNSTINYIQQWKDREDNRPFFANLWLHAPHDIPDTEPRYQAPASFEANYPNTNDGKYCAMVSHLDSNLQKLIDFLIDENLLDSTIIFFTSDNGATEYPQTSWSSASFKGSKSQFFEGGIRIPLIAYGGNVLSGEFSDGFFTSIDLAQTILSIAGISEIDLPGIDFSNVLFNGLNIPAYRIVVWEGQLKDAPVNPGHSYSFYNFAVQKDGYKLVANIDFQEKGIFLYNIDLDPWEKFPIDDSFRESDLLAEYQQYVMENHRIQTSPLSVKYFTGNEREIIYADPGINVKSGDLSIYMDFTPDPILFGKAYCLAKRNGAWNLFVNSDGRIQFNVYRKDGVVRKIISDVMFTGVQNRILVRIKQYFSTRFEITITNCDFLSQKTIYKESGEDWELADVTNSAIEIGFSATPTTLLPYQGVIEKVAFFSRAVVVPELEYLD